MWLIHAIPKNKVGIIRARFRGVIDVIAERRHTQDFVDLQTGEVIQLREGDYIRRRNPKDKYYELINKIDPNEIKHVHLAGDFVKAYDIGLDLLCGETDITANEFKMILILLPHIKPNSGFCELGNHRAVTLEWLAGKMGLQRDTAKKIMLKLKSRGVVHYGGTGKEKTIFVNPYLFYNGRYINKTLEDMFKKTDYYKEYIQRICSKKPEQDETL